jgi:16S rRNA (guanine527-N7)-methyltransferase
MDELLVRGLDRIAGADLDAAGILSPRRDEILALLETYLAEIERFNPALGLVGAKDRRELVIKHILDSLAPLGILARLLGSGAGSGAGLQGETAALRVADVGSGAGLPGETAALRVADVGSGAGLPGIPLAICLSGVDFTLIERMGRRVGFLRNCLALLALPGVETEEREMEKTAPARFRLAVFRAFRPLEPAIFRGLLRILAPGGRLAAWKGRRETLDAELAALGGSLAGCSVEIFPVSVPFLEEERHLVIIGKE